MKRILAKGALQRMKDQTFEFAGQSWLIQAIWIDDDFAKFISLFEMETKASITFYFQDISPKHPGFFDLMLARKSESKTNWIQKECYKTDTGEFKKTFLDEPLKTHTHLTFQSDEMLIGAILEMPKCTPIPLAPTLLPRIEKDFLEQRNFANLRRLYSPEIVLRLPGESYCGQRALPN